MQGQPLRTIKLSAVVCDMLAEVAPLTIVWRTMSGNFTALQMHDLLEARSETALQWLSEFLRVFRDIFGVRAENKKPAATPSARLVELAKNVGKAPFVRLLNEGSRIRHNFYWSEATGAISKEQLLASLTKNDSLAAQYVACMLQELEAGIRAQVA